MIAFQNMNAKIVIIFTFHTVRIIYRVQFNLSRTSLRTRRVKQSIQVRRIALLPPYNDDSRNILRHCERSEAIHARTLDCFTAFAMTGRRIDSDS
jgi:hypothetical protein